MGAFIECPQRDNIAFVPAHKHDFLYYEGILFCCYVVLVLVNRMHIACHAIHGEGQARFRMEMPEIVGWLSRVVCHVCRHEGDVSL